MVQRGGDSHIAEVLTSHWNIKLIKDKKMPYGASHPQCRVRVDAYLRGRVKTRTISVSVCRLSAVAVGDKVA